jgi:N-acetylglucosamine kinase-like BadF-type ATPase
MKYYLGIDQGGTKTTAVLCDETGRILGSAKDNGLLINYLSDSEETYLKNIRSSASAALSMAGLSFPDISAVCGCLNGADWDFEYPTLEKNLARATSCKDAIVMNDCIGAMRAGTSSRECAVICIGTGLNAAVRNADGREFIYGYFIDSADQGASSLGHSTLRKVMDRHIGLCGETLLTQLVLDFTGYEDPSKLLADLTMGKYELQKKDLVECLLHAYLKEDREAVAIVDEFAKSVSRYVIAGLERFDMLTRPVEVIFSGGVLKDNGVLVSRALLQYIRQQAPNAVGVDARYEPVCGAVLTLLDRHYDMKIPKQVLDEFDCSAVKHRLIRDTSIKRL